jgi:GT2 family glycosyltransferase
MEGNVDVRSGAVQIAWVVLTMGNRNAELQRAVASLLPDEALVVINGENQDADVSLGPSMALPENVGVPAGRDIGLQATSSELVGFLDDDAELLGDITHVRRAFDADPRLGAVALRLVDEEGATSRRHVPRLGGRGPDRSGEVALFLGGACVIRRAAYDQAGGYFADLFYGHEEVELCWRLVDAGWSIRYLAGTEVFHPRTDIERHAEGWERTGRNRVLIARTTLPWPIAVVHVAIWLVVGAWRAPTGQGRRSYLLGWRSGWRAHVDRAPISWRGVWRLTRLGRPPVL